ncbi:MAG: winged helix-turn-helix transcriptional regulator [Planctomycetes bacterium]|nr:winged helix-turn-helix transcriptional regulator [Planctomycetota bacterium]
MHNPKVVDHLSLTLTAVSDPIRRAILERLAAGPAAVRDLVRLFQVSQQAVSKHLACLVRAGLVSKQRRGRLSICTLAPAPLEQVATWTETCRATWAANFARLDTLLAELQPGDGRPPSPPRNPDR